LMLRCFGGVQMPRWWRGGLRGVPLLVLSNCLIGILFVVLRWVDGWLVA
jgi:hypothetical protein